MGLEYAVIMLRRLALYYYPVSGKQVYSQRCRQPVAFVDYGKFDLTGYGLPCLAQFPSQGFFVHAFQKTWPAKGAMDF